MAGAAELVVAVALMAAAAGALELSNVFQDHMVLQRGAPLRVWGQGGAAPVHVALGSQPAVHVLVCSKSWRWWKAAAANEGGRRRR